MSISHSDFFRLLPRAVGEHPYSINGTEVTIELASGRLEIRLSSEGIRQIASLTLPETVLEFSFSGVDATGRNAFLSQFDLAYQRGGG